MDLINRINHSRFFGREFLTWLWFHSDRNEGIFKQGNDKGPIEIWFDAKLVLESQGDITEQNVIKSEQPTDTDEARTSLQTGKQVVDARLRVISGQKQWTFGFKAEELAMSSLKLPALLSNEDDDQLYERFYLIEEIEEIMAGLYQDFMTMRADDERWREEVQAMRHWVHETD